MEYLLRGLRIGYLEPELLLEGDDDLQRIHGIQAQPAGAK